MKFRFYLIYFAFLLENVKNSHQDKDNDEVEIEETNLIETPQEQIDKIIKSTIINTEISVHLINQIDKIPISKIDSDGKFKYIQISFNGQIYIRGSKKCRYHICNYRNFIKELKNNDLGNYKSKPIGGGRINVSKVNKTIFIYGYSNRYSRYHKMHSVTKMILQNQYKDYKISWKNQGY